MKANNITDEKLLDYLDGSLNNEEQKAIHTLIDNNPALRKRLNKLRLIDSALAEAHLHKPSEQFAQQVMASLEKSRIGVRKGGLIIFIATTLTVLLGSYFMVSGMIDIRIFQQIDFLPELTGGVIPSAINIKLISNVLLAALSILALLLFDKTVLKPLFKNRKYQY